MAMILKLDYELLAKDLCEELVNAANEAIEHFLKDAKSQLRPNDQEIEPAVLDFAKKTISTACVFYAQSILQSYGRGSAMDMSNEYLSEYFGNTSLGWNPARKGAQIVGRPEGTYTNFFGEETRSEGNMEGLNLESIFPPQKPSYAIQNAEKKLKQGLTENGYVMRIFRNHAALFFASMNPSKYYRNEEVNS